MSRATIAGLALTALGSLCASGCAAGAFCDAAEALQTKNPHAALEYCGLSLQADPGYEPTHSLVETKLLKLIATEHEAKVAAMVAAGNFEQAVADCDRVVASAALAGTLPGGSFQIYHEDHRADLAGKAAEKFYLLGQRYQEEGDARRAVWAYLRTLGFRVAYKDARARYQTCLEAAKVRMLVSAEQGGEDARAVQAVAQGIPRAAQGRGLQFLEFVFDRGQAQAVCVVKAETASFHDTGWQSQQGQNEVWVDRRDPNTGAVLIDPATGQSLKDRKAASWTTYSRQVSYQVQFSFQVQTPAGPGPTGSAGRQGADSGAYAVVQGDAEAVPMDVGSLPNSPKQLKTRDTLATECAAGVIEELAHQLFLAYEK